VLSESAILCLAPGDHYIVLKPLDAECLLKSGLHPSIKERLTRVRELAHTGVANLYGVERDSAGGAWLVWEYVPGHSLDELIKNHDPQPRNLWVIARELIVAIEALHARGIVHGSIHERNVIVGATELVRLTHVSPLLYSEVADDETAVLDLLERMGVGVHHQLMKIVVAARAQPQPLRYIRWQLAGLIESREVAEHAMPVETRARPSPRRRALIAAILLTVAGVGIAYSMMRAAPRRAVPVDQPVNVQR
jgi:tRNA A-37 threonylcarbamoyl transferase component Bud32